MSDNSTTVNFNLRTAGFVNYANQTLTFRLLTAGATGSNDFVVLPSVVTATSDANGDGSVVLFRNGVSDIESVHEVIFPNREKAQFIIPSGTATVELSNLLVNSQPSGSSTQQSSVFAQAIQRANHTGTQLLNTISNAGTIASQNSDAVNIDGGAIDATVIGANSAAAGTFAALTSSSVDINGGAIDGAVIGANSAAAGTFAALTSTSISVSDGNITNAGDINCDSISADAAATGLNVIFDGTDTGDNKITLTDNLANALDITESTNSYLKFTTTNSGEKVVVGKALDISGATTAAAVTGTDVLASSTLGYKAGSGGTVTQGDTSGKGTAVSLNKISGEIVMDDASLADDATAVFTFNNTTIAATDVVIVNIASGVAVAGSYQVTVGAVAANSCSISVLNVSGGARTDTIKLNFAVIKAVAS